MSNGASGGGSGHLTDDQMDASSNDYVHLSCNHFENDPEFSDKVKEVELAIDHNILPKRIYEGSSGSYFCKNTNFVSKASIHDHYFLVKYLMTYLFC